MCACQRMYEACDNCVVFFSLVAAIPRDRREGRRIGPIAFSPLIVYLATACLPAWEEDVSPPGQGRPHQRGYQRTERRLNTFNPDQKRHWPDRITYPLVTRWNVGLREWEMVVFSMNVQAADGGLVRDAESVASEDTLRYPGSLARDFAGTAARQDPKWLGEAWVVLGTPYRACRFPAAVAVHCPGEG